MNTRLDPDQGSKVRVSTAREQKRLWAELDAFMANVQRNQGLSSIESISLLVFNNMAAPSLVSNEHQKNQAAILGAGINAITHSPGFTVCLVWAYGKGPRGGHHVSRALDHREQQ